MKHYLARGKKGPFAWDIVLYRSWVDNEFIDLAQAGFTGVVSATFNAGETIHQGLEAGIDVDLTPAALTKAGGKLNWRNIYTYNDFYFTFDIELVSDFKITHPFGKMRQNVLLSDCQFN